MMNKPLTIDELKALKVGDWVWVKDTLEEKYWRVYSNEGGRLIILASDCITDSFLYSDYGTKWLAYKNKEQAEANGEIVELPCSVGDTMYWVYSCDQKEPISFIVENISGKILDDGEWRFFAFNRYGYGGACGVIDGRWYLGKDKAEAERRLAELRGEK